jgi:hypothetical protein
VGAVLIASASGTARADCNDTTNICPGVVSEIRISAVNPGYALIDPAGSMTSISECNGDLSDTMLRLDITTDVGKQQYTTLLASYLAGKSVDILVVNAGGMCYIGEVRLH